MEPPLKVQDQPQFLIVEVNMLYYRKIEKKKKKKLSFVIFIMIWDDVSRAMKITRSC